MSLKKLKFPSVFSRLTWFSSKNFCSSVVTEEYLKDYRYKPIISLDEKVRNLDISPTVAINDLQVKLRNSGRKIYKFGFGQSPFPVIDSMKNELEKNSYRKDYLPAKGLNELRVDIANWCNNEYNLDVNSDNVIIGPGTKELCFLLQLSFYGELLLPNPCWVSYLPQAKILGKNVSWINTNINNNWKIDLTSLINELEKDCSKPRILILNYPNNPTGITYNSDELKALAHVCSKYGVIVLSDEIYGALTYTGKHDSISKYYPHGTILMTGISKWAGAGGYRLGAFIFPQSLKSLLNCMVSVASETYTSCSTPIQYASIIPFKYYYSDEIQLYLKIKNNILNGLSNYGLNKLHSCGVKVVKPDGAFYMMPVFDNVNNIQKLKYKWCKQNNLEDINYNNIQFSLQLLSEIGFGSLGGYYFGRTLNELSLRISYVDFDGSSIINYIKKEYNNQLPNSFNNPNSNQFLQEFLIQFCPNVINGFDILSDYIKSL